LRSSADTQIAFGWSCLIIPTKPLPWWQMLAIFVYAMVSCLVVKDAVKVAMIKRLAPTAVA